MLKQKEFIDLGKVVKNKNLSFWGKTKKVVGELGKRCKVELTGRSAKNVENKYYEGLTTNPTKIEDTLAKKLNNDRFAQARVSFASGNKMFKYSGYPSNEKLDHLKYLNNKELAKMGPVQLGAETAQTIGSGVKNLVNHPGNIVSEATSMVDEAAHNPASGSIMLATGTLPMPILGPGGYSTSLAIGAGRPLSNAVKKIPYVGPVVKTADKVGYVTGPVSDVLHIKKGGKLLGDSVNNIIGEGGFVRKGLGIDKTPEYLRLKPSIKNHLEINRSNIDNLNKKRRLRNG